MGFKFYKQVDKVDCGPTCLKMIAKYFGKDISLNFLREKCYVTREGASFLTLRGAAEEIGFKTFAAELTVDHFLKTPLPCILFWNSNHFVVLYKVKKRKPLFRKPSIAFHIADPAEGLVVVDQDTFSKCWISKNSTKGFALFLSPTEEFVGFEEIRDAAKKFNKKFFLFKHALKFRSYFIYILLAVLASSLLALTLPFITQSIVDVGIADRNINFISLMLVSQLLLFVAGTITSIIQSRLLLHISSRMNIHLVSEFLTKLMRLPLRFFESKMVGDIVQRIEDHTKIDNFLTTTFLDAFLSIINLVVFSAVLGYYNFKILIVFAIGSFLSVFWTFLFNERRRSIDYRNFQQMADNSDKMHEIIHGMPEIKLNSFEDYKRWEWQNNQIKLFKIRLADLSLQQYQDLGANFLTQLKNLIISYLSAYNVVQGDLTFGAMLSISYMTGQLNVPVDRLKSFFVGLQSVRFSLERMAEVHEKSDEEDATNLRFIKESFPPITDESQVKFDTNNAKGVVFKNVSFQYEGPKSPFVLKDINLEIPINKVTAIVGSSGSGKTTLMKLMLKFYEPISGTISLDGTDISRISAKAWRSECGVVMQDGYIFSDTIARNIAMTADENIDHEKLNYATRAANIHSFIEDLPLGFSTKIGKTGNGISAGQKQRLLIARAIYKNPSFLFFDEATSALDANNEKIIVNNLDSFFVNKTVVVIAHRLSTVKNADQLIVIENGEVVEVGNHNSLVNEKGAYFNLVKNQLELGE